MEGLTNGAKLADLKIDYAGTTGFAGEATTSANNADGYASGNFTGVALGTDGSIFRSASLAPLVKPSTPDKARLRVVTVGSAPATLVSSPLLGSNAMVLGSPKVVPSST